MDLKDEEKRACGLGKSFGFADPQAKIGHAYVPNQMGAHLEVPRDLALRTAMYRSIGETDFYHEGVQTKNAV